MREILFRGLEIEHRKWIYGYYYRGEIDPSRHFITDKDSYVDYEVDPETVVNCQCEAMRELLILAREALIDLGACNDPECQEVGCSHALPKINELLGE